MRIVFISLGLLLGVALGQQTQVVVQIPVLLKLRLDNQLLGTHANIPLNIQVQNGIYEISPQKTHLKVISNTTWQLSISMTSLDYSKLKLNYRLEETKPWKPLHNYSQKIQQGRGRTNADMTVHYGFQQLPLDGNYQVVVSYTLSNP